MGGGDKWSHYLSIIILTWVRNSLLLILDLYKLETFISWHESCTLIPVIVIMVSWRISATILSKWVNSSYCFASSGINGNGDEWCQSVVEIPVSVLICWICGEYFRSVAFIIGPPLCVYIYMLQRIRGTSYSNPLRESGESLNEYLVN